MQERGTGSSKANSTAAKLIANKTSNATTTGSGTVTAKTATPIAQQAATSGQSTSIIQAANSANQAGGVNDVAPTEEVSSTYDPLTVNANNSNASNTSSTSNTSKTSLSDFIANFVANYTAKAADVASQELATQAGDNGAASGGVDSTNDYSNTATTGTSAADLLANYATKASKVASQELATQAGDNGAASGGVDSTNDYANTATSKDTATKTQDTVNRATQAGGTNDETPTYEIGASSGTGTVTSAQPTTVVNNTTSNAKTVAELQAETEAELKAANDAKADSQTVTPTNTTPTTTTPTNTTPTVTTPAKTAEEIKAEEEAAKKEEEARIAQEKEAADLELKSQNWDSSLDKYGSYTDYDAAIEAAIADGNYDDAIKIENYKNSYIDASGSGAEKTSVATQAKDTYTRGTYWNSDWDQYGSSSDFQAAINAALANEDYVAAAAIERARNSYITESGSSEATTSSADTALRENGIGWIEELNRYGSSADMSAAQANAHEANDWAAEALIQTIRNNYLDITENTQYEQEYDAIQRFEMYTDEDGNIIGDNSPINGGFDTTKISQTIYANGEKITYYTFTDINGETHISAVTESGNAIPDGTQFLVDSYEVGNTTYETYYTWTSDGYRSDTGSWSAYDSYTSTNKSGSTSTYNVSTDVSTGTVTTNFTEFLESDLGDYIVETVEEGQEAEVEAINAATQQSINEIIQALEESQLELTNLADEAYLKMVQNQDNLVIQNAVAGNYGGLAQKQYNSAQSSYEQKLTVIAAQYQALKTEADYKVAELELDGQIEAANAVAEWAQTKLSTLLSAYEWTQEYALEEAQLELQKEEFEYEKEADERDFLYEQEVDERNYLYNRAIALLEQGILTDDALETLGISEEDAESLADYYNRVSQYNLDLAEQELANAVAEADAIAAEKAAAQASTTASSSQTNDTKDYYELMYDAGIPANYDRAYAWLKQNTSLSDGSAESIAGAYESSEYARLNRASSTGSQVSAGANLITPEIDESSGVTTNLGSMDYSPDEGVIYWNNKAYVKIADFAADVETALANGTLSQSDFNKLKKVASVYGFDISEV